MGRNLAALYESYKNFMKDKNREGDVVSKDYYERVFNSKFNIGFEPPKSDMCNLCDKLAMEKSKIR